MSPFLWNRTDGQEPLFSPFRSESIAAGAQAVNRSSVAALAFLVWDILITTGDEVKYIWPRELTYTKYVYFISRYLPMLVQISILLIGSELTPHFHFTQHDCFIWQVYQGVAASFIIATIDTILILRVHALYHGDRVVRRIVAICFVMEIAGMAIGLGLAIPGILYDNVCLVMGAPRTLIIYGASSIIFQFILFGLTFFKFIQSVRSGWGDVPLIILLMRDGTWAFFLLFCVYVGQIGLYGLKNTAYTGVLYGWLLTAFSFCGYRILLNLNRFAERTGHGEPSRSQVSNSRSRPTNTHIQFSTMLASHGDTYDESESYELTSSSRTRRTFGTSQISSLSLGN
ncbi:hypothetical protein BDN70DRAFT_875495 [Pholiota conissans]|uniref:DUF6533 domain-containing protein n=1 Tax=Pholiota conissans TaxID=109636 RepID=A0A9P5Z903_9AGAR|nr:hypothetical protein BDN70DRAFT_875495 [Pholiota conissans]